MSIFEFDILSLFNLINLVAILSGTLVGLIFGALPGLGAMLAMVVLLPITYAMTPVSAVLLLVSAFQAAEYGGSISSISLGIPGTPAAAATILDGYPMAKKGKIGKALGYSLITSTIGAILGALSLLFLAQPFARFALNFAAPEYFLIGVLGLIAVATISSKDTIKGLISMVLGLMAGTVGLDMFSGEQRFTFGQTELLEGIGVLALLVAAFAFPEFFRMINEDLRNKVEKKEVNLKVNITGKELKSVAKPTSIGSAVGIFLGIIPGLGSVLASWFSYSIAKRVSKKPETFGHGNPEGIASAESANNSAVASSLIPLLALGIPGNVGAAIIMGAFVIHGVQPGPAIFQNDSNLVYSILYGILLSTFAMYILGRLVTPLFARALVIPNSLLIPVIYLITIVGVFSANQLSFDLWLGFTLGIICFFLIQSRFSMASFVIAFVLSPIIEENFRRALLISGGDYSIFITRFYSIILIAIILLIIFVPLVLKLINIRKRPFDSY